MKLAKVLVSAVLYCMWFSCSIEMVVVVSIAVVRT